MQYASFWKRAAAYLIDGIIYGLIAGFVNNILGAIIAIAMGVSTQGNDLPLSAALTSIGIALCVHFALFIGYYVWPEASSWQATIGKRILGLKVMDLEGKRISFIRSLWRNLAMFFSTIILCIGYLMSFWTEKKQCLHDILADCVIIDTTPGEKHGCIIGIFVGFFAFLILIFVVGILAALAIPQMVKAEEKARAAKALSYLDTVRNQQIIYEMEHGQRASQWNELTFAPCADIKSNSCQLNNQPFVLLLGQDGVTIQRINSPYKYSLFRAYRAQDTQRDLLCIPASQSARRFCEQTLLLPTPQS